MSDAIHVCSDPEALAQHACEWLVARIGDHLQQSEQPFVLALSGGSTPKRLYQLLGDLTPGTVDWSRVCLVWGDERPVAPDHVDSNFRLVRENLLDHIEIPATNVLPVAGADGDPAQAASDYAQLLNDRLPKVNGLPQLDCALLGLGDDVHTASLFPHSAAISEETRCFVENYVDKLGCWRLSLTAPILNAAGAVVFLIAGEKKRQALQALWFADRNPQLYPAHLIRPRSGHLWTMVDQSAVDGVEFPNDSQVRRIGELN